MPIVAKTTEVAPKTLERTAAGTATVSSAPAGDMPVADAAADEHDVEDEDSGDAEATEDAEAGITYPSFDATAVCRFVRDCKMRGLEEVPTAELAKVLGWPLDMESAKARAKSRNNMRARYNKLRNEKGFKDLMPPLDRLRQPGRAHNTDLDTLRSILTIDS